MSRTLGTGRRAAPDLRSATARSAAAAACGIGGVIVLAVGAACGAGRASVAAGTRAAARWAATPIEDQSFEGAFPPPGWFIEDFTMPPGSYVWGRTTCTAAPGGGTASAWAVGAGTAGSGLACSGTYDAPAESDLTFGPIDTRPFEGGLEVSLRFKLDLRLAGDFQVCASNPDAPGGVDCVAAGVLQIDWAQGYFDPPPRFANAAGLEEAYVFLRFRDREPDLGTPHQGAFVDRVVITGLSDAVPTATGGATTAVPTATATRTPSATPTSSPSPTVTTAVASPTRTGSPTPTAPSATPSATASSTPPTTPSATQTGAPSATSTAGHTPSATATRTGTPPGAPTTPAATPPGTPSPRTATATPTASATVTLPPPPTVDGTVTDVPTPTSIHTATVRPTEATPSGATATATPTVIVAPPEYRIYLPYGTLRRAP